MKQQVIFIHGGGNNDSYERYLKYLKEYKIDIKDSKSKKWKNSLERELGPKFELIMPQMPNSSNAKYNEWKIWFEKYIPFLKNYPILIGHSLGGIFLVKYLSENTLPIKIKGLFLVAPSYSTRVKKYSSADFDFKTKNCKNIINQCLNITIYHSIDDPTVSFENFKKYQKCLPAATFRKFKNRGHFVGEKFPEIIKDIKTLK